MIDNQTMVFPKTFKEFADMFSIKDIDEVYSNGIDFIPVFRVEQWLEHTMAIKALEKPCEDVVSRKDVHDMLENLPVTVENKWFNWLQKACIRLAELPPVTPQPKTGHWVYRNGIRYCEFCGASNSTAYASYCPNCGANLVEPQESEDKE